MSQAPAVIDTIPHDFDVLTQAEYQERQADQLLQDMFGGEANTEKTGDVITRFVTSYEQHKRDMRWIIGWYRNSTSTWLIKRIEKGASAAGVSNVGAYATDIETTLSHANEVISWDSGFDNEENFTYG